MLRSPARRFVACIGLLWLLMCAQALRFRSPEFRPWEVLADPITHRFTPDRSVEMYALGDLSAWSWVRALQSPRHVRFTTDHHGFRNPEFPALPRIVVLGDSYAAGSGLSDDETLSARLGELLGEPVYNYALSTVRAPAILLHDRRFVRHPPEVVVYAPNQRNLKPQSMVPPVPKSPPDTLHGLASELSALGERWKWGNGLGREARYGFGALRFWLLGQDDLAVLPDGRRALHLSVEQQRLHLPARARHVGNYLQALAVLREQLARRGSALVYAPVPDHGNVYPELYPPAAQRRMAQPSMIDLTVTAARRRGLTVVDLPSLFRNRRYPYLYRLDDSHWDHAGVALAADAIADAVRSELSD